MVQSWTILLHGVNNHAFKFISVKPKRGLLTSTLVPLPSIIYGMAVETVSLSTVLDDKLIFDAKADSICKKANQRLFSCES